MPTLTEAFNDAGAPLANPLNNWSAIAPDRSFIAMTIWEHEWRQFSDQRPLLGPLVPGAYRYFRNTPEYIAEWNATRVAAGRPPADSTVGWRKMKEHLGEAFTRNLPVKVVFIWPPAGQAPDGAERAQVNQANYVDRWSCAVTYFDRNTGSYEIVIRPA